MSEIDIVSTNPIPAQIPEFSRRRIARITGYALLIMFVFGILADSVALSKIVIWEDPVKTMNNILNLSGLFRLGIASYLGDLMANIVVSLGLYMLLKPINKGLALFTICLRLVYVAIRGGALLNLVQALQFSTSSKLATEQLADQLMMFINADTVGYTIGLVFFGFHVLLLGYLIFRSGFLPKALGIILMTAFMGYMIYCFTHLLLPDFRKYEVIFTIVLAVPAVAAELSLCLWLIFKNRLLGNS